jgi:hypothetical protein
MKTIVKNESNVSLYLFDDDVALVVGDNDIVVGNPAQFIIGDCNAFNVTVYEQVSDPGQWQGWKYLFDGTAWTLNPDWQDPALS